MNSKSRMHKTDTQNFKFENYVKENQGPAIRIENEIIGSQNTKNVEAWISESRVKQQTINQLSCNLESLKSEIREFQSETQQILSTKNRDLEFKQQEIEKLSRGLLSTCKEISQLEKMAEEKELTFNSLNSSLQKKHYTKNEDTQKLEKLEEENLTLCSQSSQRSEEVRILEESIAELLAQNKEDTKTLRSLKMEAKKVGVSKSEVLEKLSTLKSDHEKLISEESKIKEAEETGRLKVERLSRQLRNLKIKEKVIEESQASKLSELDKNSQNLETQKFTNLELEAQNVNLQKKVEALQKKCQEDSDDRESEQGVKNKLKANLNYAKEKIDTLESLNHNFLAEIKNGVRFSKSFDDELNGVFSDVKFFLKTLKAR